TRPGGAAQVPARQRRETAALGRLTAVRGYDDAIVADLRARVDRLVADLPPATTQPEVIWEAQFDEGLAWVQFPVGFGGLALDIAYADVIDGVLVSHGVPRPEARNLVGVCTMAPTLAKHGTPDQLETHLRDTFTCKQIRCQLFS